MRSSCFRRSTFVHRLPWWTFFLWIRRRRSNIFRVLGRRRTSCSWRRTFVRSILGRSRLCIIMILLRSMGRIRSWRSGVLGKGSSWRPIFSSQSSINQGIWGNRWLRTWRQRLSGSSLRRLGWSISRFWNRYHIRLRYRRPCRHRRSRPINGQIRWRYKVRRRYRTPLVMGRWRRFPWFCQDILLLLWRSKGFPFRIRFLLRGSGWSRILTSNRILRLLFWRRPRLSRSTRLLRCSDPWPSCFRLRFVRKRSCLVWRVIRMVRLWRSPWYLVRDP